MSKSYVQILSSPGWLTRGRGEKRRDCAAARRAFEWHRDLRKEFCAKEPTRKRERQREESGRQESGIKA
jgi:hypothetical protein